MKVLVTGGAGRVGRATVMRLTGSGHEVTMCGRSEKTDAYGARYVRCDITDVDSLLPLARTVDAIVHLAAIPGPAEAAPEEIFRVNCAGTFAVYEAAARAGVRRVINASSINAVGFNFGSRAFPIPYLPVDEQIPGFSTDAYSFSKQITEKIADYGWRRDGTSSVSLRMPWVAPAALSSREIVTVHVEKCRASLKALMALSESERRARTEEWIAHLGRYRSERRAEAEGGGIPYDPPDPLMYGRTDFWTRIDERDSAQAIEKSLTAGVEGSHVLFVNDSHNITGVPSLILASLLFPEAEPRRVKLDGTNTLVSIDAARRLIGFEPEFSVARWF